MALRNFGKMFLEFLLENPNYEDELEQIGELPEPGSGEHLFMLLHTTYDRLAERLKAAALELKKTVVAETWDSLQGQIFGDFSLYSGALGTAFLLWKSFRVTGDEDDLRFSSDIIKACDSASLDSRDVSFIYGRAGVCALGAVVAKSMKDEELMDNYVSKFRMIELPEDVPDGLLHGRAGYLWACLFINKHLGEEIILLHEMAPVIEKIVSNGRKLGRKDGSPFMFEWNGKKYLGAAHGVAGIMYVLMHFPLPENQRKEVKETLVYMINNQLPSGNYPACEEDKSDVLVHWCHGAPGIALTLAKAAKFFGDELFLHAARNAAKKVVWVRGLLRHVGICHGISGNTYVLQALCQLTGSPGFRFKAKSFTSFLLDRGQERLSEGKMCGGDHPYSLFEGIGGMASLFLDMIEPSNAKFPAYEL
ncbi:OLC1v1000369C1 [Oldenlandia corymbosa var. corymbosa]|uniref:OLC1v1000369C1 n=1 Tax=Oldenlandia corymbosa var. corymbosa TaxID=529605 RepID=A0AAV1D671_OLDCO|nr:OLC1v1000369C1 [Oldenlandia corymbosa var. corymbosa]